MNHLGAVNFVVHKIKAKNHPASIAEALGSLGYKHEQISDIFIQAGKSISTLHQELIAVNDFLPPLGEDTSTYFKEDNLKIFKNTVIVTEIIEAEIPSPDKNSSYAVNGFDLGDLSQNDPNLENLAYPGPLPTVSKYRRGVVTRHSFVFKLFYSISLAVLGIIVGYIAIKLLEPNHDFSNQFTLNYWQSRIYSPSIIALLVMSVIFAFYILYLFARRLHDAGMNQWLTMLLLTPMLAFIFPLSNADRMLLLGLSIIPCVSVFLISALVPSHKQYYNL